MWKPAERIKHKPRPGVWPTAEQAASARLFAPLAFQALKLESRTWVPAMVPWRATENGDVTEANINWYRRFAAGGPGAIVVEATGIRDVPSGPLLRIGHDRFIPGLQRLTEAVRAESGGQTRLFIQLIDFLGIRRRPEPEKFFTRFLVITPRHRDALGLQKADESSVSEALAALPSEHLKEVLSAAEWEALTMGYRERITDVHLPHIAELPQVLPGLFADAAERAVAAGFDGIELHYAHAYTMASFLSPTNTRQDGYGGSLEGRLRLPLEVLAAVRERVGVQIPVGCRYLAEECIDNGTEIPDAEAIGVAFAKGGMDFISLSRGGKFDDAKQPAIGDSAYPYTGRSGYECMPAATSDQFGPFGRNAMATKQVRAAIRAAGYQTPVVMAGGIHGFEQAEGFLADETGDIVGLARQALADPDWFVKVRSGQGPAVRLCTYSNYCEGLDQKHKTVTCQLWDRVDLAAPDVMLTADGRRRMTAPVWKPE